MNCVFENISVQKLENLQEMYKRTLRAGFLVYGILVVILFASFLATSLITGASSPVYIVFFVIVILLSGNWMIQMPKKMRLPLTRAISSSISVNRRPTSFFMEIR